MIRRKRGKWIQSIQEEVSNSELPIVVLDQRWHALFFEGKKPRKIQSLEKELNQLLKQQSTLIQKRKKLKARKKRIMDEIVQNMQEVKEEHEVSRQEKLEKFQKEIGQINAQVEQIKEEMETLPSKIKERNQSLLLQGVEYFYNGLHTNERKIQSLEQWILDTRKELAEQIIKKQELEELNTRVYAYMHDIVGVNMMDMFDESNEPSSL